MRLSVVAALMFLATTAQAREHSQLRAFSGGRCLAPPGAQPGTTECGPGAKLALTPINGDPNRVMIRGPHEHDCLFSNRDGRFAWSPCNETFSDQFWDLVPLDASADPVARNSLENFRTVRNENSGRCLFSNVDGRFGVYDCASRFYDQFWTVAPVRPAVQAFNSGRCLNPGGMADCGPAQVIELVPGGEPGTVMLKNAASNQCLFSNRDGRFAWYGCNPQFGDQFWRPMAPAAGAPPEVLRPADGYRMLKNANSGRCVYSNRDGRFAVYDCAPRYDDQFWRLVRTARDEEGYDSAPPPPPPSYAQPPPPPPPMYAQPPPPPPPAAMIANASRILSTDKAVYNSGEPVVISWTGMAEGRQAWVTVVPQSAATDTWGDWAYTGGGPNGGRTATQRLAPGVYEARAYPDNGTNLIDRIAFTVR